MRRRPQETGSSPASSDCCEEIEKAEYIKHYLSFLDDIIESVEYEKNIDHKNYLYVGIEVGSPTVDDIVR